MPDGFTDKDIAALAALAHLDLSAADMDLFARQLGDILAYANEIQQVDTSGIPPTAGVLADHPSDRTDEVAPSLDREAVLANAPDRPRGATLFRVPRVIG
ncbi:MAG: Asp-tRNA(Asn)/Glu-tRNA(Gln) amidotransferase subunit GatC [Acidobacteriota bacterium]